MVINRYHIYISTITIIVLALSYFLCLHFIDSILLDYDVISMTGEMISSPESMRNRASILQKELDEKEKLIVTLQEKKPFYPNIFRDIGVENGCNLTNLETVELPKNGKTQYRVVYTGKIKPLLNLLNSLESNYYLIAIKTGLKPETSDGTLIKLIILLQVANNE